MCVESYLIESFSFWIFKKREIIPLQQGWGKTEYDSVTQSATAHENVLGQNIKRKWLMSNFGVMANYIFIIN